MRTGVVDELEKFGIVIEEMANTPVRTIDDRPLVVALGRATVAICASRSPIPHGVQSFQRALHESGR